MTDDIDKLKKEKAEVEARNAKLIAQNAELIRENAALKANPTPKPTHPLLKREWDVLKYFFDQDRNITAGEIATNFGLQTSVAKSSLDILVALGFLATASNLSEMYTTGQLGGYIITPEGRFLIDNFPEPAS